MTAVIAPKNTWLVANLVRAWHRIYCVGIDAEVRETRALELESDLWEQQQDATLQRHSPARAQLDVAGRLIRGIPADISWRLRLEGPHMSIKLPFERLAGGLLLLLGIVLPIAVSISGYDTAREGWESELRRLSDIPPSHTRVTIFFQALCGIAIVGAGAGFFTALRERTPFIAGIAGFGLLASGILTLVSVTLYAAISSLADDFFAGNGGAETLVVTRSMALTLDNLVGLTIYMFASSVLLIAYAAWRHSLVAAWLRWVAIGSGTLVVAGLVANFLDSGEAAWLLLSFGFLALLIWLLLAGISMLVRPTHLPAAVP